MVDARAGFIVRNGPVNRQDRWEEDGGYRPFTLARRDRGAARRRRLLDGAADPVAADYLRETADCWNDRSSAGPMREQRRLAAGSASTATTCASRRPIGRRCASPHDGFVPIKNRPPTASHGQPADIVSPDALALVRFGLRSCRRSAHPQHRQGDRRAAARCDLPQGPVWYRYNEDGYGEHADGAPFDGSGDRPAVAAADRRARALRARGGPADEAQRLLATLEACAGTGGLLPEQVWDSADIPERELLRGGPSGSAMPLVWAHAEHIKLLRSLRDGAVFDMPPQGVKRYIEDKTVSPLRTWRFNNKIRTMPAGKRLRIELRRRAVVHWSSDNWANTHDDRDRREHPSASIWRTCRSPGLRR